MRTVEHILQSKGSETWHVAPDEYVIDALRLMAQKNIGALVVLEDEKLVGILSERDYARKVVLEDKSSKTTPVRDIMSSKVVTVGPSDTMDSCMELMTRYKIRHLPVMVEDRVAGVISIGDVVKAIISQQEYTIAQLQNYITGHAEIS
jgi:CBS domain-containing protein